MIGTIWPWARVAPQGRNILWLAILLISASGLITGVALRPLLHGMGTTTPHGGGTTTATSTPAPGTVTATLAPAVTTPQRFAIAVELPAPTAPGGTMTVVVHATAATKPAQGVTCQISFTPLGGITLPGSAATDATGSISFAVAIPATTPPGTYTVHVHATWGTSGFAANWDVLAKIT